MCRIAGIIHPDLPVSSMETMTGEMCELLRHGGPDDGGVYTSPTDRLSLGNRRLSLLDLTAGGHQPMQYANRYTITYNGELYNFKKLKEELTAEGMQFINNTDTEVILAAFAKWHTQSFSKLNGMFAFALWDNAEKMLYLVRDAAGIKPLYYSSHTGGLTFASEIRGFAPVPYLREPAPNTAVFQLAYGYIPEPVTTLANVHALPKGCFISYSNINHTYSLQAYSFFSFSNEITDRTAAVELTKNTIADAVIRQMIADAPVGVFLSGGVDSAIIAKLAARPGREDLHTLSIHFSEEKYSEKKYQDILVERLNSTHHSFLLEEKDFHDHFPSILAAMDMPSCDGINTWFISKFAAAEGLKAVLSGIGADELFGGYPSFRRMKTALAIQRLPAALLKNASNAKLKKLSRLAYLRIEGIRGIYLFLRGHFTPVQIAGQVGGYEKEIWNLLENMPVSQMPSNLGPGNIAGSMEFNLYMQDQLLRDADVMSMAHGLEIRVPFLDNEVIRAVFAMSEKLKFNNDIPKEILINAFTEELPEEIWKRKKMGFSFPFAEWLRSSEYVNSLTKSNNPHTRQAFLDFMNGKLHWSRIMSLIVLHSRGEI
ncbi:MAG: asparagine synthase (glutamine-hydrolyzing) [Ferruginibacter sp.]